MPETVPVRRRSGLGEPEVHHHHPPRAGQHHVLGLEVPVHEPGLVDRLEPGEELRGDLPGLRSGSGPRSRSVSAASSPSMYSIETSSWPSSSTRSKMRQTFGDTHLAGRARPRGAAAPGRARTRAFSATHRLQRHVHPQLQVEGPEHLAHPAAAEQLADLVALAEDATGVRRSRVASVRARRRRSPLDPVARRCGGGLLAARGSAGTAGTAPGSRAPSHELRPAVRTARGLGHTHHRDAQHDGSSARKVTAGSRPGRSLVGPAGAPGATTPRGASPRRPLGRDPRRSRRSPRAAGAPKRGRRRWIEVFTAPSVVPSSAATSR